MGIVSSVNLGRATSAPYQGGRPTGIDKRPVGHPVLVRAPGAKHVGGSGLAGDDVCDLRFHGGNDHAVYAYALEDLQRWSTEFRCPFPPGSFGENLTTTGIDISSTVVGTRWRVGMHLVLEVSDPRIPCRTFAEFLGRRGWVRTFTERAAPGTYLRVIAEGVVSAGDRITELAPPDHGVTVRTVFRALTTDRDLLAQLAGIEALSADIRGKVPSGQPQ